MLYICNTNDSHSQGLGALLLLCPVTKTGQHAFGADSVIGGHFGRFSLALFNFRSDLNCGLREEGGGRAEDERRVLDPEMC